MKNNSQKKFGIEFKWINKNGIFDFGWILHGWYKTEKQRNEAFKILNEKEKREIYTSREYRKIER